MFVGKDQAYLDSKRLATTTSLSCIRIGKIKTTMQMTAIIVLLCAGPAFPELFRWLGVACLYIAAFLTLWSMILYLKAASKFLRWDSNN